MPEQFRGDTPPQERDKSQGLYRELKEALQEQLLTVGEDDTIDAPELKSLITSLEQTGTCDVDRAIRHIDVSVHVAERQARSLQQKVVELKRLRSKLEK